MDRDKLLRWQKDLAGSAADAPAVYAIFLVSETDRSAHDIFRAFRTSFEKAEGRLRPPGDFRTARSIHYRPGLAIGVGTGGPTARRRW